AGATARSARVVQPALPAVAACRRWQVGPVDRAMARPAVRWRRPREVRPGGCRQRAVRECMRAVETSANDTAQPLTGALDDRLQSVAAATRLDGKLRTHRHGDRYRLLGTCRSRLDTLPRGVVDPGLRQRFRHGGIPGG